MKRIEELGISTRPWTIEKWSNVNDARGNTIASVMAKGENLEEEDANARVIAAAPELYEALWTACSVIDEVLSADDMKEIVFKLSVAKKHMLDALAEACGEEAK